MTTPNPSPEPDPTLTPYATQQQAMDAGAAGTPEEIDAALLSARVVIDRYTRHVWAPTQIAFRVVTDDTGTARLPMLCYGVDTGILDDDGHTWMPDGWWIMAGQEWVVVADAGTRNTPVPIARACARLAAVYSPEPFTAQADAEGNPIGRPPATTEADQTDPGPPQIRSGQPGDRTTGDAVVDAWLEPFKMNRVMVS
jgi:hypothetical protein